MVTLGSNRFAFVIALNNKSTLCMRDNPPGLDKNPFPQVCEGGFGFTDEKPTFRMGFWSKTHLSWDSTVYVHCYMPVLPTDSDSIRIGSHSLISRSLITTLNLN
jgi:hypothetical protein